MISSWPNEEILGNRSLGEGKVWKTGNKWEWESYPLTRPSLSSHTRTNHPRATKPRWVRSWCEAFWGLSRSVECKPEDAAHTRQPCRLRSDTTLRARRVCSRGDTGGHCDWHWTPKAPLNGYFLFLSLHLPLFQLYWDLNGDENNCLKTQCSIPHNVFEFMYSVCILNLYPFI